MKGTPSDSNPKEWTESQSQSETIVSYQAANLQLSSMSTPSIKLAACRVGLYSGIAYIIENRAACIVGLHV